MVIGIGSIKLADLSLHIFKEPGEHPNMHEDGPSDTPMTAISGDIAQHAQRKWPFSGAARLRASVRRKTRTPDSNKRDDFFFRPPSSSETTLGRV